MKIEKKVMKEMFDEAFGSNDLEKVKGILKLKWDLKLEPYLTVAISRNNSDMVKILLDGGADPNAIKDQFRTRTPINPLELAIHSMRGTEETLKILLEHPSIDINKNFSSLTCNDRIFTPLEYAIYIFNIFGFNKNTTKNVVKLLLEKGAYYDICSNNNGTMNNMLYLMYLNNENNMGQTISKDGIEIFEGIVDNYIKNKDKMNHTYNISYSVRDILKSLFSRVPVDDPLFDRYINSIKKLLGSFSKETKSKIEGYSIVENLNNIEMVKVIVDSGIPIYSKKSDGKKVYPYFRNIKMDSIDIINFLLDNGANIDEIEIDKYTPDEKIIELFLNKGGDIKSLDIISFTIKSFVKLYDESNEEYENRLIKRINDLVEQGAILNKENAFLSCSPERHPKVMDFLISLGLDFSSYCPYSLLRDNIHNPSMVKHLVRLGINIDHQPRLPYPNPGGTLLHHFTRNKRDSEVKTLLSAGANPNAVDRDGNTPLHILGINFCSYIVDNSKTKTIAEALCKAGASLSIKNNRGRTPISVLRNSESNNVLKEYYESINSNNKPSSEKEKNVTKKKKDPIVIANKENELKKMLEQQLMDVIKSE